MNGGSRGVARVLDSQVKFATCTLLDGDLTWWNSHVQAVGFDEAYEMSWKDLMKLMIEVYCPRNEIQKLGNELWNLCVKGTDIAGYTRRFQELTLMCPRMVPEEEDKIKRFIWGLPDNIKGNVTSSQPAGLQDAIKMANSLMDQKVRAYAARNAEKKRKLENQPRDNRVQQPPYKRQNVVKSYTVGTNEKKAYAGTLPYCNKYKLHHSGPCTVKCLSCKKGHYKSDCPKLKNQNHGNQAANTEARGGVFALGEGENNNDSNVVTSTFLLGALIDVTPTALEVSYAVELADERVVESNTVFRGCTLNLLDHPFNVDLLPVELGSFDVIIGNGYPRKGQKSKPKRQNRARERKDREKSKRPSQSQQKNQSQSQPGEVALEKASKTKPENLNCQKWAHPYPPSGPGETKNELYKMMEDFTERMNQELHKQEVLLAAQREQELLAQKQAAQEKEEPPQNSDFRQLIEEVAFNSKLLSINSQYLDKEKQEVKNIAEPTAKHQTRISPCLKNFKVIHKESIIPLNKMPQICLVNAITPDLPTEEPEYSLIMGNEKHSTISKKESDEFIKYSVEDLIPIPRESKDTSDSDMITSHEDVPEDVKIYSNPLFKFDDEYISSDVNPLFDEVLEDIECKDSYDSNLDESTFLVTPLSDSNEDGFFTPNDDVELLFHHDPSISIVSNLEGFIDEPPLEENDDLIDLE
ncbi:reverse transcriptase domain-containing protein [Tanacetum coccineum]